MAETNGYVETTNILRPFFSSSDLPNTPTLLTVCMFLNQPHRVRMKLHRRDVTRQ